MRWLRHFTQKLHDGVTGSARIGRIESSKSGKTLYYQDQVFESCDGRGFKCNFFDSETEVGYWISGCKKYGGDRLYPGTIEIDEDVREEYWTKIRNLPEQKDQKHIQCSGKYGGKNAWKV